MPGAPAERSLFSRMVQGSKSFSPSRCLLRTTGSSSTDSPVGSWMVVGSLISGLMEPMRTFSPAMWKMRFNCSTFDR